MSNNVAELEGKRTELQGLRENKVKWAYVRLRVQWFKEGEKPSKYFCVLEHSNYLEKTMKHIQKPSGEVITNQKEILTIKKFQGHVISPEQSGFISEWYIGDSTCLIYDLMSITEQKIASEMPVAHSLGKYF